MSVSIAATCSPLVGAVVGAGATFGFEALKNGNAHQEVAAAVAFGVFLGTGPAIIMGILVVLLFGAPMMTRALARGFNPWTSAVPIGLAPALLVWLLGPLNLALGVAMAGITTALLTMAIHLVFAPSEAVGPSAD